MAEFVNCRSVFSFSFVVISLFFLCLFIISSTEAKNGGFTIELIHLDSPKSPFYNPNETPEQRLRNIFHRSVNRLNLFDPNSVSPDAAEADIIPNFGDYLMNIAIGTPPVEILAVADTGSDLIWTQCNPCPSSECFKQDAPLFFPEKSSTYKDFSCSSTQCTSQRKSSCSTEGKCLYSVSYGDKSFSKGNLATDTVTLGSTTGQSVPLPETTFGCGHNNDGTFNSKTTGIVGLGGGDISLTSQIGASTGSKFSYCLVPYGNSVSSKINFGSNGVISGSGVVSTPLTPKDPKTFYFLTLEAITVGDKRIGFGGSFGNSEGNIVIDSGTTLTILPQEFQSELLSAVSSFIQAEPIPYSNFDLCYDTGSISELPEITVNFRGADVKLSRYNFILTGQEIACFNFIGSNGEAIYGNVMQGNFLISYDIEKNTVSFKPTDCTK